MNASLGSPQRTCGSTGYPRGLKGEQIPLVVRIVAVVDVWDARRSDRPYRPAWPEQKRIVAAIDFVFTVGTGWIAARLNGARASVAE